MSIFTRIKNWLVSELGFQFPRKNAPSPDRQYGEWNGMLVEHRREEDHW